MIVYLVGTGEYSEYRIEAVFLNKDKAELYAKFHNGMVEEYETMDDDYNVEVHKVTYYDVYLSNSGSPISTFKKEYTYIDGDEMKIDYIEHYVDEFYGAVVTDTEEQAIKIMQDRRAKWLADTYGL